MREAQALGELHLPGEPEMQILADMQRGRTGFEILIHALCREFIHGNRPGHLRRVEMQGGLARVSGVRFCGRVQDGISAVCSGTRVRQIEI